MIKKIAALSFMLLASSCGAAQTPIFAAAPQTVRASWYGRGEKLNRCTSTGERFNPMARTAAHRTLPFGTRVAVTYRERTVIVRINDRGPAASTGRDLDLSLGSAQALGILPAGEARVAMRIIK